MAPLTFSSPVARKENAIAPAVFSASCLHRRKVLLVEDHDLVRLGVKALFSGPECAAIEWLDASTLADSMRLQMVHSDIALVLLDLNLADSKGLSGLSQILLARPGLRVIILSGTHDEFVVRQARTMGAAGYLHKGGPPEPMRETLCSILDLDGDATSGSVRDLSGFPAFRSASKYDRVAELGTRHLEILELVLSGCTNQEISNSTRLSLGTVKNYVSTILLALDVKSRSHLISLFR